MKISNLEGIKEIRLETAYGHRPIEIREAHLHDGVLTLSIDIDVDAAAFTCTRPSLEADERDTQARFERQADLDAAHEFGDEKEATIL